MIPQPMRLTVDDCTFRLNEVTIEVSQPVATSQGVFALDKFTTTSTEMCKVGESMVLSGLVQEISNHFKNKTPLLGDIPLLSLFFSEKTADKTKQELVVLVTPTPVFPQVDSGPSFGEQRKELLKDNKE